MRYGHPVNNGRTFGVPELMMLTLSILLYAKVAECFCQRHFELFRLSIDTMLHFQRPRHSNATDSGQRKMSAYGQPKFIPEQVVYYFVLNFN